MSGAEAILESLDLGQRVFLVSDIHANVTALRAALELLEDGDAVVFLGDLLTYGCHPAEVVELVEREMAKRPSALLWGNHDQMYRDLIDGDTTYYDGLPAWLRETVDWTLVRVDPAWFADGLRWSREIVLGDVLVDHANPYEHGDWTYVDTLEETRRALNTLRERGYRLGIFGHTHRAKLLVTRGDDETWIEERLRAPLVLGAADNAVWNVGSIGQPRSRSRDATFGVLRRREGELEIAHEAVGYDVQSHVGAVRGAGFTDATRAKLVSFFGT